MSKPASPNATDLMCELFDELHLSKWQRKMLVWRVKWDLWKYKRDKKKHERQKRNKS